MNLYPSLAALHSASEDTIYRGYLIKKGTIITGNAWYIFPLQTDFFILFSLVVLLNLKLCLCLQGNHARRVHLRRQNRPVLSRTFPHENTNNWTRSQSDRTGGPRPFGLNAQHGIWVREADLPGASHCLLYVMAGDLLDSACIQRQESAGRAGGGDYAEGELHVWVAQVCPQLSLRSRALQAKYMIYCAASRNHFSASLSPAQIAKDTAEQGHGTCMYLRIK